jgi:AcrR family transcriptional regulator
MTNKKTVARRERRIAARTTQILDAAAQVFAEKGFHAATTREIADVADVSEGTIYNYFDSKDDLLLGIMNRLTEQVSLDDMLDRSLSSDPREFFLALLDFRYGFNVENQAMIRATLSEVLINPALAMRYHEDLLDPVFATVERYLETLIDAGRIKPVDTRLLTLFFSTLFAGLSLLFLIGDLEDRSTWDALSGFLVHSVFDDLFTPGETPVTPGETPVTPGETPVTPGETPVTPGETPVTPGESPGL